MTKKYAKVGIIKIGYFSKIFKLIHSHAELVEA